MGNLNWRAAHQQWSTDVRGRKGPAFVEVLDNIQKPMIVVPAFNDEIQHLLEAIGIPRKVAKTQADALVGHSIDAFGRGEAPGVTPYNARGEDIQIVALMDQWDHIAEKSAKALEGYGLSSKEQFDNAWHEHYEMVDFQTALGQNIITPDTFGHGL